VWAGPGPGAYKLPTTTGFHLPDPSRYRNPMYSFGTNAGYRVKQLGPGPAYRIDRITRDGAMYAPAWSFGARSLSHAISITCLHRALHVITIIHL
jgi:hypothetical protein